MARAGRSKGGSGDLAGERIFPLLPTTKVITKVIALSHGKGAINALAIRTLRITVARNRIDRSQPGGLFLAEAPSARRDAIFHYDAGGRRVDFLLRARIEQRRS